MLKKMISFAASNIDINMEISMPKLIQDIVIQMHFYIRY